MGIRTQMEEKIKRIPNELDRIFDFQTAGMIPPNRIVFGFGAVDQIGKEAMSLAKGKVLVISDKVLEKINVLDHVTSPLTSVGFTVETFTDVEPEPHIETAEALYDKYSGWDVSLIVGIGGGSVMDISKLIAQSIGRKRTPRQYLDRKVSPDSRGIPLILVPTTAGTGSEVSPFIVITIGDEKRFPASPYYFADMAIIDPLLNCSMPPIVTASTGIDALSHAIEAMLHKNANPFVDSFAVAGIEMVSFYLRRAVACGEDLEARYYMSMAATLSMMAYTMTGGLYAHSAAYVMSLYKPTPHGIGCGLGLPYAMRFNLPVRMDKLRRIARALGENGWMQSPIDAANLSISSVVRLIKDVGLPYTLKEYGGIKESDLEKMAEQMITIFPRPMNPRTMTKEESVKFWKDMWHGTLD
jgi:alcohol dehydrogenase class IV